MELQVQREQRSYGLVKKKQKQECKTKQGMGRSENGVKTKDKVVEEAERAELQD